MRSVLLNKSHRYKNTWCRPMSMLTFSSGNIKLLAIKLLAIKLLCLAATDLELLKVLKVD